MREMPTAPVEGIDPRFKSGSRKPGLDLLRALAIVLVVFYHAGLFGLALPHDWQRFGWVGVDLFFVLSGYLIGGQLLAQLQKRKGVKLGRFYARRALRILPAYLVVVAVYFCLPKWREFPTISPLWKFLLSVQNINLHGGTAFSHAWSLAVEDQFYLLLPLLLLLLSRSSKAASLVPGFIVVAGLVLRAYLAHQHPGATGGVSYREYQVWIYYPTWTRLDPLVFGVALAAIEQYRASWWSRLTGWATWLWLPGLAAIMYGLYLGEADLTIATCVWQLPLIALGMAMLLVCSLSPRLPISRVELPGAAFLASIAYSVYLSHKLVIHLVIYLSSTYAFSLGFVWALLLALSLIYITGTVLFLAVERPFLQLRKRIAR
jgi:peptidoglycan/LPS O-acetylase OafA/YrhL